MTEYTSSSQAIREYMTSRQRTAYWVQSHTPHQTEFYSPSVPPSVLDGFVPSSPSEAESSHSIPPRMVLRYGDGRPDIPIPPGEPIRSRSRRHEDSSSRTPISPHNPNHRQRSGSHGSSPLARSHHTHSRSSEQSPPAPEEIRVLPSRSGTNEGPRTSSSSHHTRSRSLPRPADLHSHAEGFVPPPVLPQVPQVPLHTPAPAPHPSAWHSYSGRHHKQPPSIVYAPSHHSRTHYAPPAMYNYPPQMGPNGMIYSHSAPVNYKQFAHDMASAPYPHHMVHPSHVRQDASSGMGRGSLTNHDRTGSLSARHGAHLSASSSSSSVSTEESGGTYYVLPHQGQKVHIITPSPQRSVETATSTTRSPTSPTFRKPFLQRLFSFARFPSVASSKASFTGRGRRLKRRHSTGGSAQSRHGMEHDQ